MRHSQAAGSPSESAIQASAWRPASGVPAMTCNRAAVRDNPSSVGCDRANSWKRGTKLATSGRGNVSVHSAVHAASWAAGCLYCRAHTGTSALRHGVSPQKLADLPNYRTSPLFSPAERVAIDFAHVAAMQPNAVDDATFAALREHWSEAAVVEILGVVGLFGFFNRWNDSMATTLEPEPLEQARQHLGASGWTPGKHQPAPPTPE